METKRMILARFVDFDVNLQMRYYGNQMSDFPKKSMIVEKFREINFSNYLPYFFYHFLSK